MSRFSAFAIHLGISFLIFLVLAYLIVFDWYPGYFFQYDGGWRGMQIIVAVDLVLGPLLTLVVFKAGKPGLRMDLSLICLFQAACLIAGTYIVYSERPLAVVYLDSRFEVITADDLAFLDKSERPDFDQFPGDYPKWVRVDVPTDLEEASQFRRSYFSSDRNTATAVHWYAPFDPLQQRFVDQPRSLETILRRPGAQDALDQWVETHGGKIEDYNFYTFSTRYVYLFIGFDKETGQEIGFLDTIPI